MRYCCFEQIVVEYQLVEEYLAVKPVARWCLLLLDA